MRCPADRCRAGTSKERAICERNFSGFPLGFSDRILVGFGTLELWNALECFGSVENLIKEAARIHRKRRISGLSWWIAHGELRRRICGSSVLAKKNRRSGDGPFVNRGRPCSVFLVFSCHILWHVAVLGDLVAFSCLVHLVHLVHLLLFWFVQFVVFVSFC